MPRALPFIHAAVELENALTERLQQAFAAAALTSTQFHILYMLVEEGPMTMSALATQQRCVKSNISYITRTMQRDGLIELTAGEVDQRTRTITPTGVGRQRYAVAKRAAQKIEHALRRSFGAAATDALAEACLGAAGALDRP